jgi:hypothetical protein
MSHESLRDDRNVVVHCFVVSLGGVPFLTTEPSGLPLMCNSRRLGDHKLPIAPGTPISIWNVGRQNTNGIVLHALTNYPKHHRYAMPPVVHIALEGPILFAKYIDGNVRVGGDSVAHATHVVGSSRKKATSGTCDGEIGRGTNLPVRVARRQAKASCLGLTMLLDDEKRIVVRCRLKATVNPITTNTIPTIDVQINVRERTEEANGPTPSCIPYTPLPKSRIQTTLYVFWATCPLP